MKYWNLLKKEKNNSIIIISFFILIFPFIIDYRVSDMVLSIRFLALSLLILILYFIKAKQGFNIYIIKNPIIICLIGLLLINIISAIFNLVSADSIFSIYRICILLSLTLLFSNVFRKKNFLILAKSTLFFCLTLLTIYFIQVYILAKNEVFLNNSIEKISSTMGNKNLLASVFFLSIPFIFYVYYYSTKFWKTLSAIVFFLIIICLVMIQSKAVLLALTILFFSFFILSYKSFKKQLFYIIFSVSSICSILFCVVPDTYAHLKNEVDQVVRMKNRIIENRIMQNDSRISLYIKTFEIIKSNPFLGVGPGKWRKEISKYGLKDTIGQKGDKFVQRPHSDFLWYFSEGGFFSFAFYLFFLILLLRYAFTLFRNEKTNERYFYLIIFSTILGYIFISALDFPSERPSHNFLLSALAAIIISQSINKKNIYYKKNILSSVLVSSFFVVFLVYSILIYNSNLHMSNVLRHKSQKNWNKMIIELDAAYHPVFFNIDNTSTPLDWYYGIAYFNKGNINSAFNYFNKAYQINQYHLHVINNLATCYGYNNDYISAENLYKECMTISPRFEEAALNLANIYFYNNKEEKALDVLLKVRDFQIENHQNLLVLYLEYLNKFYKKINKKNSVLEDESIFIFKKDKKSFLLLKKINNLRNKKFSFNEIIKSL